MNRFDKTDLITCKSINAQDGDTMTILMMMMRKLSDASDADNHSDFLVDETGLPWLTISFAWIFGSLSRVLSQTIQKRIYFRLLTICHEQKKYRGSHSIHYTEVALALVLTIWDSDYDYSVILLKKFEGVISTLSKPLLLAIQTEARSSVPIPQLHKYM